MSARSATSAGDQSVELCGLRLAHPVINGSGTFDVRGARRVFGADLDASFPFSAFVSKTITREPRRGNPPPRLFETPAGLINSIGLPNPGLRGYIDHELPALATLPVPIITNVMGSNAADIKELFAACQEQDQIAAVELNVSCPNVKTGLDIGSDPRALQRILAHTRAALGKPLIVKLTPNCANVAECALAAQEGGADALSLINTLRAAALAPGPSMATPRAPWLGGRTGGLSGPAIRTVALAQVQAVSERVAIPVIGMGGVQSAAHARDLLDVGARLVAVGTASFHDPLAAGAIARHLALENAPRQDAGEPDARNEPANPRKAKRSIKKPAKAPGKRK